MTEKEAVRLRHSVRRYTEKEIEPEAKLELEKVIADCNEKSGLNFQLVSGDRECFNGFLAHYGNFKNTLNYIAVVGNKKDGALEEKAGYYGQKIVLAAQMLGLNTCWVGGTFSKGKCKAEIGKGEKLVCVISVGYGEYQGKERKSKSYSEVCDVPESEAPDWFKEGVAGALMAPTAVNQQKFFITLRGNNPVITAKRGIMVNIDLGIVKYNFEVMSGHNV